MVDEFPAQTAFVAAALKDMAVVKEPRCPKCNRMQANWTVVASFTCPECKTQFIIGANFVTVLTQTTVKIKV